MRARWTCPLCRHENSDKFKTDHPTARYCDDAQDGGCGEGPFLIRPELRAEAFLVQGQDYLEEVPITTFERLSRIRAGIQEWDEGPGMSPAGLYHYLEKLDELLHELEP